MRYVLAISAMVLMTGCSAGSGPASSSSGSSDGHYRAKSITSAGTHTCAIGVGGASCWGNNGGTFGNGHSGGGSLAPSKINFGTSVSSLEIRSQKVRFQAHAKVSAMDVNDVQISTTDGHTCGIDSGSAYCWGDNTFGQNGDGAALPAPASDAPAQVVNMDTDMLGVSTAPTFACGIKNGAAYCWGANDNHQLGDGTTTSQSTAVAVQNLTSGVTAIGVNSFRTACAIMNGDVYCWGTNGSNGLLGDGGVLTESGTPIQVVLGQSATALSVGEASACALLADSTVSCWGANDHGELGNGTTGGNGSPQSVQGLSNVSQISAGSFYACAVSNGNIFCWGANYNGNLGIGANNIDGSAVCASNAGPGLPACTQATQVPNLSGMLQVTTDKLENTRHTCAIRSDFSVMCWGDNSQGQLGDGTTVEKDVPTYVLDTLAPPFGLATVASSLAKVWTSVAGVILDFSGLSFDHATIQVAGVFSGDTVHLYSDSACTTEVGNVLAVDVTASITVSTLAAGVSNTYYSNQSNSNGAISNCSSANVSYTFAGTQSFNLTDPSGRVCGCQLDLAGLDSAGNYTIGSCIYSSGGLGDASDQPVCDGYNGSGAYTNDGTTLNMSGLSDFQ